MYNVRICTQITSKINNRHINFIVCSKFLYLKTLSSRFKDIKAIEFKDTLK